MSTNPQNIDMRRRPDDLFVRHGITWQRRWQGGPEGTYVWRSQDGRLEAWRCGWQRIDRVDAHGEVHTDVCEDYRATCDGELVGQSHRLRDSMDKAALAGMQRGRHAA